ncbi:MAG: DUF3710 domain-containing protein [Actinomycetaceae bacterium]|nr:DUF3710 domain-containing protein [Actinomycetaceae bacterium]
MGLFGKKKVVVKEDTTLPETPQETRAHGPWDISEKTVPDNYLDFGTVKIPMLTGLQIQPVLSADRQSIERLNLMFANSVVQILAIATPRSGNVAGELLNDTEKAFKEQGADVKRAPGRWGRELQIAVPVAGPDGQKGITPLRVVFIEGNRWALRIDMVGAVAVEDEVYRAAATLIDNLIVERDKEPRAPLSLIRLNIPRDVDIVESDSGVEV